MAITGMQRSLTAIITKTVAGDMQDGYPRTYYGRNEFFSNGNTYPAISVETMANMPTDDYLVRLSAFKHYIEGLEQGLSIEDDTVEGNEAYRENLTACPI